MVGRLALSPYVTIGRTAFRHRSGRIVRPIYSAARAQTFVLDEGTAAALVAGNLHDIAPDDSAQLHGLGILVDPDVDQARAVVDRLRANAKSGDTRRFVVMPTAYCNMGCGYCGQQHSRAVTGTAHRAALVERFRAAARSGRYSAMSVRWFGGEPLMGFAILRGLSREFVAIAASAGLPYSSLIVTNGALLDLRKARALVLECGVTTIEITLDGVAAVHEASRPLHSGRPTFDRTLAAIRTALDDAELDALRFSIRTNVGRANAGGAAEFAATMAAAGLADPRVVFYPAPLHDWGNDVSAAALSFADMARVEMQWLRAYVGAGLTTSILPRTVKRVVCTAVSRDSEVVAPDGRIYSCTEQPLVPGDERHNVADLGLLPAGELRPAGAFDDWHDTLDAGATGCHSCKILPVCGGACPKLWREGSPPCPTLRVTVEDRLDLYASLSGLVPARRGA